MVRPKVEAAFGFASVQMLDFADPYAGKLADALSRQHPRDLFDVSLLLEDERVDGTLWRSFLIYLTCSPKPAWEMLEPRSLQTSRATFNAHFRGMTSEPASGELLRTPGYDPRRRVCAKPATASSIYRVAISGR